jgi:DnaK suppressor protein
MAEELTEQQVEDLRALLEKTKDELRAAIAAADRDSQPVSLETPIGRLSRMDALQSQGLAQVQLERSKRRLALMELALKKLEEGDYGYCAKCDEPIGFARLKISPEMPFCVACSESQ